MFEYRSQLFPFATLLATLLLLPASLAGAHPGHGTTEPSSFLHLLFEPSHVLFSMLAIALAVISFAVFVRRSRKI